MSINTDLSSVPQIPITPKLERKSTETEAAARTLQSYIRGSTVRARCEQGAAKSLRRKQLHEVSLRARTVTTAELPQATIDQIPQLPQIIDKLANNQTIVPSEAWHITTWENLASICKTGFFAGANTLKEENITYTPNALNENVENTDLDTLCMGSYLIDYIALTEKRQMGALDVGRTQLKPKIVQIKIDTLKAHGFGKYNTFFKIKDFYSPIFDFELKINDWLSVIFKTQNSCETRRPEYYITVKVDNLSENIQLTRGESIIYGNLYETNKFCLTTLFHLIEKDSLSRVKAPFYQKLKQCSEAEITKILKLFGQHLTIFSEINFHSRLYCSEGLIKEIYDLNTGKLYSLRNLEPDLYRKQIHSIASSNFAELPFSDKKLEMYDINAERKLSAIFGKEIRICGHELDLGNVDYSNVSPEEFSGPDYVNYVEDGQRNRSPGSQK